MELAELKTLLKIPAANTAKDEFLSAALPLIIEHVQQYCNDTFTDESGTLSLPGGVKLAIAQMVRVAERDPSIASQKASDLSLTFFEGSADITSVARSTLRRYRKARFT